MGEIEIGDLVFDHKGKPYPVTNVFDNKQRQVYAVKFENNHIIYADGEHNWYVSTPHTRITNSKKSLYNVWTTEEIMKHGLLKDNNSPGESPYHFLTPFIQKTIEYKKEMVTKDLPLHPYLLGLCLGNDTTIKNSSEHLNSIGLGSDKYIPDTYKTASLKARQELLKGLLENNQSITKIFSNTNKRLVDDFISIASSLGYKTIIDEVKVNEKKTIWNVSIDNVSTDDTLAIIDIYPVPDCIEDMRCISVDSPDNTYLVGDALITTHNTSMMNAMTGFYKPKVRILTLEDNLEMKPNPKKFVAAAMECKDASPDKPNSGITMRDLVHASMQLRPDVVIVGEVTNDAAYDLVQALNTGHAGMSTVHSNSSQDSISRLSSLISQSNLVSRESAYELISSAFDIVVSVKHFPTDGSRRIVSIDEVGREVIEKNGKPFLETTPLWIFVEDGKDENGKIQGHYKFIKDLSDDRKEIKMFNIEKDLTWDELKELSSIPEEYILKEED